jgi:N4-gp56 family major capsid protein
MTGSSQTLQLNQYFSEAAIAAAKTPLLEEVDVAAIKVPATIPVVLTPLEYGSATVRTLKLANRTMVAIDPVIARVVADHCRKTVDALIQDKLANATNTQFSGAATSIVTTTATTVLSADAVRRSVLKLRVNQSIPWFGDLYAVGCHPSVVYELRKETGSGGWRQPNEYGASQENIWNGEIGAFEGARFVENARTRVAADGATGAFVARSYFFGREALAESVVTEPNVVIGPVIDRLNRFKPIGWYGDLDFEVFRNESLVINYSGSASLLAALG